MQKDQSGETKTPEASAGAQEKSANVDPKIASTALTVNRNLDTQQSQQEQQQQQLQQHQNTQTAVGSTASTQPSAPLGSTLSQTLQQKLEAKNIAVPQASTRTVDVSVAQATGGASNSGETPVTTSAAHSSVALQGQHRPPQTQQQTHERSASLPEFPVDPQEEALAAIRRQRYPLTEPYHPYICPSDTCIEDARLRLKTALEQTRQLRQAFSDRLFTKYRVTLVPPPQSVDEIVEAIQKDPESALTKLQKEMEQERLEKELELKELRSSTEAPISKRNTNFNVDHPDQLMYMSAGLNLVMLPEGNDNVDTSESGLQRARSISQAAATSGDIILDRTRKAIAMRHERLKKAQKDPALAGSLKPVQYSRPVAIPVVVPNAASLLPKTAPPPPVTTGTKKAPAPPVAKKARTSSTMSSTSFLSIHPHADQLDAAERQTASIMALTARGVGSDTNVANRLRHPYPESQGGRRRAGNLIKDTPPALLQYTLPPLPTTKDRLERKPLSVIPLEEAATKRAKDAIQTVLEPFQEAIGKPASSVGVLHHLLKTSNKTPIEREISSDTGLVQEPSPESDLDPTVAYLIMRSVGLLGEPAKGKKQTFQDFPSSTTSRKLEKMKQNICKSSSSLTETLFSQNRRITGKRALSNDEEEDAPTSSVLKRARLETRPDGKSTDVPLESIRGGGKDSNEAKEKTTKSKPPEARRSESSSRAASNSSVSSAGFVAANVPGYLNPLQLAQQLQSGATFNNNGEAAAFMSGVPQQHQEAYELFAQAQQPQNTMPAQASLALGLSRQSQAVAEARALLAREQQVATMMHGQTISPNPQLYLHQQTSGSHLPAAVSQLGNNNGFMVQNQQYAVPPATGQFVRQVYQATIPPGTSTNDTESKNNDRNPAPGGGKSNTVPSKAATGRKATNASSDNRSKATDASGIVNEGAKDSVTPTTVSNNAGKQTQVQVPASKGNVHPKAVPHQGRQGGNAHNTKNTPTTETAAAHASSHNPKRGKSHFEPRSEFTMKVVEPKRPSLLNQQEVKLIGEGGFHTVIEGGGHEKQKAALQYMLSLAYAIPIPKAMVANKIKEGLSSPGWKNPITPLPCDVVASVITVWLWSNHEKHFQVASSNKGQIEADPDCKWFIQATVDLAVRDLLRDTANDQAADDSLHARLITAQKMLLSKREGSDQAKTEDTSVLQVKVEIQTAAVVSKALMNYVEIVDDANEMLPKFQSYLSYLDEVRLAALEARAQERTLLASLVSRRATMTESFANAYVSAIVRAGEAIGHGKLFEAVQDEDTFTSTMLPYDVFTEENGEYEDPCKPAEGMSLGQTAEVLTRRAHARAMIQKSLRKLQDKQNIKGGTPTAGPYADAMGKGGKTPPASSPRTSIKRRNSMAEPIPPGTGSAKANTWNVYQPRHSTDPLVWESSFLEHLPYGRHSSVDRRRSLSLSLSARTGDIKKTKKVKLPEPIVPKEENAPKPMEEDSEDEGPRRSTVEIPWSDVADIFQEVEVPKKASSRSSQSSHHESTPLPVDGKIFAPFCRPTGGLPQDDDESSTEEDISDEAILGRHVLVLDRMKQRMAEYVEARRLQQERRKNRGSKARS